MSKKVTSFSDGGSRGNPGPSAIGILLLDEQGQKLFDQGEIIGETTNNVAEYEAVIRALQMAEEFKADELEHFVDSQLIQRQLSGEYRIKAEHLKPLFLKVKEIEKRLKKVTYCQVPREHEKIKHVDRLVNLALDRAGF